MLLPRFSIRALLIILTIGAVLFLIAGMAVRGNQWAWGVPIAALSVALVLVASAIWFMLLSLCVPLLSRREAARAEDPSSAHTQASPTIGTSHSPRA
jgi:hypothetical protein